VLYAFGGGGGCHTEIALHTAENHSSYMAEAAHSQVPKIQSDCLVTLLK
jgi:hypothetical protein